MVGRVRQRPQENRWNSWRIVARGTTSESDQGETTLVWGRWLIIGVYHYLRSEH